MGSMTNALGSASVRSRSDSCVTVHSKGEKEYIKVRGFPQLKSDWGAEGFEISMIRVQRQFNFHWGVCIQCKKTGQVMAVNRDMQGLDVSCRQDWDHGLKKTLDYLELSIDNILGKSIKSQICKTAKGVSGYFKEFNYLPRKMLHGAENADQKQRECEGPTHYEYQLLGEVNTDQVNTILADTEGNSITWKMKNKITSLYHDFGPYKLFTNNCQDFALEVIRLFGFQEELIYVKCTDYSFGYYGYYKKKPKFVNELYDALGLVSNFNGKVMIDNDIQQQQKIQETIKNTSQDKIQNNQPICESIKYE